MASSPMSLMDAFKNRHGYRTFKTDAFTQEQSSLLIGIVNEANQLETPFHTGAVIGTNPAGIGKDNVIQGENGWVIIKIPKDTPPELKPQAIRDGAFRLQYVVMQLARNNIDSIWIAGTFHPEKAEALNPNFSVPGAIAYGIKTNRSAIDQQFVNYCQSDTRLPIDQLFNTVPEGKQEFCEALRSGPSAINKQPWRFVFQDNEIHLFNADVTDYSQFDMGIALANIYLLVKESGHEPHFIVKDPAPQFSKAQYIISCNL